MNPRLAALKPYPFERLNALKKDLVPQSAAPHIPLSIGEPKHPPPDFVVDRLTDPELLAKDLATYPATRGSEALRESIAAWVKRRFGADVDAETQVLPVAGTREALFSFAQAVIRDAKDARVLLPNPFYQIYEGATLLAGAEPVFISQHASNAYQPDFDAISEATWQRTQLLYVCSPSNPTGTVLPIETLQKLIERAHHYDFVIAADECYSEIYLDEDKPPTGLLEASAAMGNTGHSRCVIFHSLSKRSNLPGLRSGFVAGDGEILGDYFQYRTYEGCALPAQTQAASALAWADEAHVLDNRAAYRQKFVRARQLCGDLAPATDPAGGFYWWLQTPVDAGAFAANLFVQENVTVLPGTFLSRPTTDGDPGQNHVRMAWVAPITECEEAAQRLTRHLATY